MPEHRAPMNMPKIRRSFEYHDQPIGDAATHRLVVIRKRHVEALAGEYVDWGSAYGFLDERGAREGARAYMLQPDVVAVWVEAVDAEAAVREVAVLTEALENAEAEVKRQRAALMRAGFRAELTECLEHEDRQVDFAPAKGIKP